MLEDAWHRVLIGEMGVWIDECGNEKQTPGYQPHGPYRADTVAWTTELGSPWSGLPYPAIDFWGDLL